MARGGGGSTPSTACRQTSHLAHWHQPQQHPPATRVAVTTYTIVNSSNSSTCADKPQGESCTGSRASPRPIQMLPPGMFCCRYCLHFLFLLQNWKLYLLSTAGLSHIHTHRLRTWCRRRGCAFDIRALRGIHSSARLIVNLAQQQLLTSRMRFYALRSCAFVFMPASGSRGTYPPTHTHPSLSPAN